MDRPGTDDQGRPGQPRSDVLCIGDGVRCGKCDGLQIQRWHLFLEGLHDRAPQMSIAGVDHGDIHAHQLSDLFLARQPAVAAQEGPVVQPDAHGDEDKGDRVA